MEDGGSVPQEPPTDPVLLADYVETKLIPIIKKSREDNGLPADLEQRVCDDLRSAPEDRRGLPIVILPPLCSGCDVRSLRLDGASNIDDIIQAVAGYPAISDDSDVSHPCRMDVRLAIACLRAQLKNDVYGVTIRVMKYWSSPAQIVVRSVLADRFIDPRMELLEVADMMSRQKSGSDDLMDHRRAMTALLRQATTKAFGPSDVVTHAPVLSSPIQLHGGNSRTPVSPYADPRGFIGSAANGRMVKPTSELMSRGVRGPQLFIDVCPTLPSLIWSNAAHRVLSSSSLPPQSVDDSAAPDGVPFHLDVNGAPGYVPILSSEMRFDRHVTVAEVLLAVLRMPLWRACATILSQTIQVNAPRAIEPAIFAVRFGDSSSSRPRDPFVRVTIQSPLSLVAPPSAQEILSASEAPGAFAQINALDAGILDCLLYSGDPPQLSLPPDTVPSEPSESSIEESHNGDFASDVTLSDSYSDEEEHHSPLPEPTPAIQRCLELADAEPATQSLVSQVQTAHKLLWELGLPTSQPPNADPIIVPSAVELLLRQRQLLSLRLDCCQRFLQFAQMASRAVRTGVPLADAPAWMGGAFRKQQRAVVIIPRPDSVVVPRDPAPSEDVTPESDSQPTRTALPLGEIGDVLSACILRPDILGLASARLEAGGAAASSLAYFLVHSVFGCVLPLQLRLHTLSVLLQGATLASLDSEARFPTAQTQASSPLWPLPGSFYTNLLVSLAADPSVSAWSGQLIHQRFPAKSGSVFGDDSVFDILTKNAVAVSEAANQAQVGALASKLSERVVIVCLRRLFAVVRRSTPPQILSVAASSAAHAVATFGANSGLPEAVLTATQQSCLAVLLCHAFCHALIRSDAPGISTHGAVGAHPTLATKRAADAFYQLMLHVCLPPMSPLDPFPPGSWLEANQPLVTASRSMMSVAESIIHSAPPLEADVEGEGGPEGSLYAVSPSGVGLATLVTLRAALAVSNLRYAYIPVFVSDMTTLAVFLKDAVGQGQETLTRLGVNAKGLQLYRDALEKLPGVDARDEWVGIGVPLGPEAAELLELIEKPLSEAAGDDQLALSANATLRDLYTAMRRLDSGAIATATAALSENRSAIVRALQVQSVLRASLAEADTTARTISRTAMWFLPRALWPPCAKTELDRIASDQQVADLQRLDLTQSIPARPLDRPPPLSSPPRVAPQPRQVEVQEPDESDTYTDPVLDGDLCPDDLLELSRSTCVTPFAATTVGLGVAADSAPQNTFDVYL